MSNNVSTTKLVVVPTTTLNEQQTARPIALVNPDGSTASTIKKQANQTDTAGGATLATLIADFNSLLAKLRAAGILG